MCNKQNKKQNVNMNNEEAVGLLNRLLEWLHQADLKNFGSRIQLVYVAAGAQHVDRIEVQNVASPLPQPSGPRGRDSYKGERKLPDVLSTEKAMALWRKAQEAGFVDDDYQPLLTRTQAALLADAMAVRLGIKEKWKVFEELWHRNYMRNDYNVAFSRKRSYDFMDELKAVLG